MSSTVTQEEKVRVRAFELFVKRGRQTGHELDDWLTAEKEVTGLKGDVKTSDPKRNGMKSRHFN